MSSPAHAFAAVSATPPQQRQAWCTPKDPSFLRPPLAHSPRVASPRYLRVVAQLEPWGGCGWVQPPLHSTFFFFFFFWVGQGGGSAAKTMKGQRGEMVSRPPQLTVLWSDAPSSGTACSLELSLLSPTGIWFKTPLPVGGANTAASVIKGRDGHLSPSEYSDTPWLQRPGVWGSPAARVTEEYPLNLQGASCPTLAVMTPACN